MIKKIALILTCALFAGTAAEACPSGLRAFNKKMAGKDTCILEGTYTGTLELTSGFNYIILGAVYIGSEKRDSNLQLTEPLAGGKLVVNSGGAWTGM